MTCKAMTDPARIRRCDDPEIKRRALTMLEQNILPVSDIAKILGLAHSTVTKWAAEAKPKVAKNLTPAPYARGLIFPGGRGGRRYE
jgi:transposase-like protein